MTRTNRLAQETSPYLRQHAENPVDWYPWGDEAFAAARERDVPVLLSVGYSACHWCHVAGCTLGIGHLWEDLLARNIISAHAGSISAAV